MAKEYVACYAYGKRGAPLAPLGSEDTTTIHVGQPGFFSLGYTLCGRKVSRRIHKFPNEATCRGCKRRWELATGARERPRTLVNEITNKLRNLLRRPWPPEGPVTKTPGTAARRPRARSPGNGSAATETTVPRRPSPYHLEA